LTPEDECADDCGVTLIPHEWELVDEVQAYEIAITTDLSLSIYTEDYSQARTITFYVELQSLTYEGDTDTA
jgi:hypothetical protein